MPKFDAGQVQELIAQSRINALSLDTQALREQNYNLSSPAMVALKQFNGTSVSLLISEVVMGEIKGHVAKAAADAKTKLTQALRDVQRKQYRPVDEAAILASVTEEPAMVADRIAAQLQEEFGFRIHPIKDNVDIAEVMRRYFQSVPPFEARADKKSEFPDAIVLLSLEAWATRWNAMLLVVSKDAGWRLFAEESARLICVDEIATALDLFNKEDHFVAERIISLIQTGETEALCSAIALGLEQFVEEMEAPDYEAWSAMDVEMEFIEVELEDWNVDSNPSLRVLAADESKISFVFDVELCLSVTGNFEFSVSDREDTMPMGSAAIKVEHRQTIPIAVEVNKTILSDPQVAKEGEIGTVGVGTIRGRFVVRFGDVEPDDFYGPDEPDEEGKGGEVVGTAEDADVPF